MLPAKLRFELFDRLSIKTMRYVQAVSRRSATGLVRTIYDMIAEDFFLNGSLTSRSQVPRLLAAIWTLGRESILVDDKIPRTDKEAMTAVLSQINDCPYCEDMLISLVHAGRAHRTAVSLFARKRLDQIDETLRRRIEWVRAIASFGEKDIPMTPFTKAQLPEGIAALMAMSDINRFSHVVMAASPVSAPFGLQVVKSALLRLFGVELRVTKARPLAPGRTLDLLPPAPLPPDMAWARANPRIAEAVSRWAAAVEEEAQPVIATEVQQVVARSLGKWNGEIMPMSRSWVETEVKSLDEGDHPIARLALVLAKAPYQVDRGLVDAVVSRVADQASFIRILAWASYVAARSFAARIARVSQAQLDDIEKAA
jgi:AhpD family alkylhydroperoxidase